ncbi:MAG: glycerophosphodiester phosphodiesterase [Myxococcota bacterium]
MAPRHPFLDHTGVLAFAHRGGAEEAPENTLAAFEAAFRLGFRYLETDAHLTSDGVLLAFHDDVLDRVTDRTGRVADLPWSEVRRARVGGTEPIPRLEDLLSTLPDARINIDPKSDAAVEPLAAILERHDALDRVCVGSFSDHRLRRMRRRLGPRLCTSMGPREVLRLVGCSLGLPTGRFAADCAQVPVRHKGIPVVTSRFVRAAHRRDLQVHVWTVNDADEMRRLLDLGVDGLITDRPSVLKALLQERSLWARS